MKKIFQLLLLFISCFFLNYAYAQTNVTGTVHSSSGEPIVGATVRVNNSQSGTITNNNGTFSINASQGDSLTVSSLGFESKTVLVTGNIVDITLSQNVSQLSDLVVIGYGTVKKEDLTGSVSVVDAKDLTKMPAANLSQALQGNVPGLWTNQSNRQPGAEVNIALRGNNSFSGNQPLFIVDGMPIASGGGVDAINPSDIESVSVLKDASSTAIYGARAANGVILITTKSGKAGQSHVSLNVYAGVKSFANRIKTINGQQLAALREEAYKNDGVNGGVAVFRPEEQQMLDKGQFTNWMDEVTGKARPTENIQLSFSGGTENTKVFVSGDLYREKGIINHSDFTRGSLRANIIQKIGKKITLTSNNNLSLLSGRGVTGASILYPATIGNPLAPVRQPDGEYYTMLIGVGNTPWANPVAYTELINNRYTEPVITSSLALEYQIVPGLKIKSQFAGELDSWKENLYVPKKLSANYEEGGRVSDGFARVTNNVNYNWMSETTLYYDKLFNGVHRIDAVAGFSAQQNRWENVQTSASGFPFDTYETWNLGAATGDPRKPSSDLQVWTMNSYIGRITYTYNNKYILTGNIRADGSSRFGSDNKWGIFPGIAAAWKLSEEEFIKNINLFNELKIRGSYGLAGNASALGVYTTQSRMSPASYNWAGAEAPGYYLSQLPYDNLKWETTKQFDLGIDAAFFDSRLNLTLDYYLKNTKDLLRQLPILAISGFQTGWANLGNLRNQGIEASISGNIINGRFNWNSTFMIAGNRNKLTSLGDGTMQIGTTHWVGKPIGIGARYMIEKIGIWQTKEAEEAAKYGAKPGDVKYNDLNGDNKIDDKDRGFHGNLTPSFYGSWTNNLSFENFDLNFFFTFEKGRDVYNGLNYKLLAGDGYDGHRAEILDRWTPDNPTNKIPRAALGSSNRLSVTSTEFLEKADFIKLRSLTLGYTLANSLASKIGASNIRLYITGINLLTITGYSGVDPEDTDYGNADRNAPYPITRTIMGGLNLTF